jgi:hypothetical protein
VGSAQGIVAKMIQMVINCGWLSSSETRKPLSRLTNAKENGFGKEKRRHVDRKTV